MTLEAATSAAAGQSLEACGGTYDGKIAGLYDLEETLGSGHFAVVKLARHVFTGAKVAVKVVDKMKLDDVSKAHLFQEVRCMKLVQHPNVVRLYEVIDTQTKLYLVLELGDGGDLYDYIMKHEGGLNEDLARKYFRQILRAITYCHQLHVVHRDLKPENVVFFEKLGIVKLTDFGFSNKFSPGQKLETFCGSLAYSAPEILLGDSYDAPAVDIWSLGVILYMLVCGQAPFEKANDSETLTCIMDCNYTVPKHITVTCRNLIASMLVRDPKKRANLEEIAADEWVKANADYDTSEFLPLVSRQELTDDDHTFIIQKMINGNIAAKEDILLSLEKDKYNHITATYFLLAEMRLRKRREDESLKQHSCCPMVAGRVDAKLNCVQVDRGHVCDHKMRPHEGGSCKPAVPISISVTAPAPLESETKADKRSRKCSIVREEDEDESSYENVGNANELAIAITRRESISDGRLNRSVQKRTANAPVVVPMVTGSKMVVSVDAALAHKLNQIDRRTVSTMVSNKGPGARDTPSHETSVDGARPLPGMHDALKGMKELEIGQLKPLSASNKNPVLSHRRTKINKIRTPSSSSEASDDDTKSRSKKKINKFVGDTPTRFRMHRRDSHDDSSDSQDQTFPSSGSHSHTANIIAANNSNVSGKSDGRTQGKEQNKTEDTRKSSHSHKNRKQPKDSLEKHSHSDRQSLSVIAVGRRCIRESQSLDRITEAQEYELRHRCFAPEQHFDQRNSLFNLNSFSVAETKEEYDYESELVRLDSDQMKNTINEAEASLKQKRNKHNSYNLNSIEEIDLILEGKSLTKAVQVTSSKCFVTMKKIRRLGKYFPVVNFS